MTAMGINTRPTNVPALTSNPKVEPQPAQSHIKVALKTAPPDTLHGHSSPPSSMSLLSANPLSQPAPSTFGGISEITQASALSTPKPAPAIDQVIQASAQAPNLSSSQPATSIFGRMSVIARTPATAFGKKCSGLGASRWADTNVAVPSFSNNSTSATSASAASTSTLSVPIPVPVVSILPAANQLPASVPDASSQFTNSTLTPTSASVVSKTAQIVDLPALSSASPSAGAIVNGSGTLSYSGVPTTDHSSLNDGRTLIENNVKANRNGGVDRLVKLIIRQEAGSRNFSLKFGSVVMLQTTVSGLVFRSTSPTNMTLSLDSDTYNISFQLPQEASAFENLLLGYLSSVPTLDAPTASAEPIFIPAEDTGISSAPSLNSPMADFQPFLHLPDCVDNSPLIDFSDGISESLSPPVSALDDLASLNYDPFIIWLLDMLNKGSGGNFWKQENGVSGAVVMAKLEDQLKAYFTKGSTIFAKYLPADLKLEFIKETSKSVVEAAGTEALESKITKAEHILQTRYPPCSNLNLDVATNPSFEASGIEEGMKDHQQIRKPRQLDDSQETNIHETKRKYSVKEILVLRDVASIVKEELISRAGELEIDGKLLQASREPSKAASRNYRAGTVSKAARTQNHRVLQGEGASGMAPVVSFASAGEHAASEPAQSANLLASVGQKKPVLSPSKNTHSATPSKDLTRLTGVFTGLNNGAEGQNPTVTVSGRAAQNVMAEFPLRTHSNLPAMAIIDVNNDKEEMAKAQVPGLSSSRWSQPSSLPLLRSGSQPLEQPQYVPVYKTVLVPDDNFPGSMKPVTGLEVIDTIPVVAHQMVQPRQENLGFGFQSRPNAYPDFNATPATMHHPRLVLRDLHFPRVKSTSVLTSKSDSIEA